MRITHEQKELAIEAIRVEGTMQAGAKASSVTVKTLNNEMNRSAIFKRRLLEAREEGKRNIADQAIDLIKSYAKGDYPKTETDRNRLTAAIALANAFEPGFRGVTTIQGKVVHDVRISSAVPRPKYDEIEPPKIKILEKPKRQHPGIRPEENNLLDAPALKPGNS